MVAVVVPVTLHPPHRSQHAQLTHWAPTSGPDAQAPKKIRLSARGSMKPLIQLYRLPYPVRRILQSCLVLFPGPGFSNRVSLGQSPCLHHLCGLQLNTWPIRTPVNASALVLLPPPHDPGPVWIATPSPYGTFIHYTLPVLTGAFVSNLDS
jgi:hypothetical protein